MERLVPPHALLHPLNGRAETAGHAGRMPPSQAAACLLATPLFKSPRGGEGRGGGLVGGGEKEKEKSFVSFCPAQFAIPPLRPGCLERKS